MPDSHRLSPKSQEFLALTNDRTAGIALNMESDVPALLVAFGGMAGHMGMPPFEFFRISEDLDVKKAYLRDLDRGWYHLGVPGVGDGIEAVADALRTIIEDAKVERTVFAGNSAGGFAALLFGTLVGADEVLCFSPQTLLRIPELEANGDQRWSKMIRDVARKRQGRLDPRFEDLREVLAASPPKPESRIQVHYCQRFDLDAFHAERLEGCPNVELHGHPKGGHGVIRALRATGELSQLLSDAVTGEPGDPQLTAAVLGDALFDDIATIEGVLPFDDDLDRPDSGDDDTL